MSALIVERLRRNTMRNSDLRRVPPILVPAILVSVQVAFVAAATGWYRQIADNGLGRAVQSQLLQVPNGLPKRPAPWPARLVVLSPQRALAGLRQFKSPRWLNLSGHSVIVPRTINRIYLWRFGSIQNGSKLNIVLAGDGRSAAVSIPLELQTSSDHAVLTYGRKSRGATVLAWSHSIRALAKSGFPLLSFPLVRRFQLFLPPWANHIVIQDLVPRLGPIASLGCTETTAVGSPRKCIVTVSFSHAPILRALSQREAPHPVLRTFASLLLAAGAPSWNRGDLAKRAWKGLAGESPEARLRLAFGLTGHRPRSSATWKLAGAMAAADYAWEIGPQLGRLYLIKGPGYQLYFCSAPEPRAGEHSIVHANRFYLFDRRGSVVARGVVAASGDDHHDKTIDLAMGACGLAGRSGRYKSKRAAP